jgi:RHS repeat-associated protein
MKRIVWSGVIALALVAIPAVAAPPVFDFAAAAAQASSETVGTPRDPGARTAEMRVLQETLVSGGVKQALRRPVTVQLSETDHSRINDTRGVAEGKYLVGVAQQVGTVVDFSSARSLDKRIVNLSLGAARGTGNGGFVWTAAVEVPGATALRLHLTGVDLPAGARLYVYNLAGQAFGPYTRRGPLGDGVIHTNTVFGKQLLLQLHVPADARTPRLTVAEVGVMGSRFVAPRYSPAGAFDPNELGALSNNADCVVNAASQSSSVVNTAKDAVASMLFQSGGSFYICTGALVADTVTSSVIPYFLTANHCISSSGEASSLETYFDYQTTCSGPNCTEPYNNNGDTIGATIKSTDSTSDSTLLQLASTPVTADGVATYLGWLSTPIANTDNLALYRISHPKGSPQAYSEGVVDTSKPTCRPLARGNFIYSRDTFGAIEGGSDGSPLLNGSGQIVGQLSGACGTNLDDVCDSGSNGTVDGAFAISYPSLVPFLNPSGRSRAVATGMGRPPASYPTPPERTAKGPVTYSPSVSDPTGNSLSFTMVNVPQMRLLSDGRWWGDCYNTARMYPGMNYATCGWFTFYDAVTGGKTTTNNSWVYYYYDACGTLIYEDRGYGLYDGWSGGTYLLSPAMPTAIVHTVGANPCPGTWRVDLNYTQTFTNGATLTISASKEFNVYPSKEAADAAAAAEAAPQPPPTDGPIDPAEQLGGDSESENPVHCKGAGDPVDTATGNFWHTFCDLSIPGRGPALDLSRTYNSLAAGTDGPFGHGWSSSYGMSLTIDPSTVVVHQESGAQATFTFDGTRWTAPPRVLATLEHNADGTWAFTRQSRKVYTFDSSGRLTAIADLNGYRTTVTYLSASTMVVTDPAGRSLTFTFTGSHVTSVQDSSSPARSLSYGYDAAGNLTDVIDVGGGHWQFSYDGAHRMLTMRSPRYYGDITTTPSPVLTNHYDDAGRVDWQTDQLGRVTTFDYTSTPGATKVTDPKGNTVVYGYTHSLLTTVTAGGASWYYRYDPNTLGRISEFDPNGHTTTSTYDSAGNLTSTTDGLGRITSYTYNALRQVTSVTEPKKVNGQPVTTTMTYDSAGNLLTRSAPLLDGTGATIATATTTYHYDDPVHPDDVTSVTDPNGHTTRMSYDSFGYLTSVTDAAGNTTTHSYDTDRGWRTSTVSPKGNVSSADPTDYTTTYAYDAYGRPTVTRDPMWTATAPTRHQTVRHYDADSNLDSVTDGDGHTTTYAYNAAGERVSATRPDGTTLRADYWPDGTLRRQYDGAGQATAYAYDTRGQLASITDPLGRTTQLRYDPVGKLLTRTDPSGRTTKLTYDAADQLVAVDYSDPATPDVTNISYDADGQRVSMTDGTGTATWTWDTLHRMTSTTNGAGRTVSYHYDLGDRLTAIDYPGATGTVTRSYDDADRLTAVTDWNNRQTTFDYDADSNLTTRTYPNGTTATSTYDRAGRPTDIRHALTTNPAAPFASFGYGRSGAGLVTSVTSTGVPSDTHAYGYDALNRLTSVDTATYGYDAADNLTKRLDNTQQVFDVANEVAAAATNPPISLVGTASAGDATSGSLTLALPAGTAPGDQMLLAATLANGKSVTTPAGYTVIGTYNSGTSNTAAKVVLYRRTVAAGDSSVTVSFTGKIAKTVALAVYRGVHTTNPIDVVSSGATAAGTSVTAASLAATAVRDRLVMVTGASGTAGTWSMPADMTARVQRTGGTTDAAIADQALTAVGASGARTATHSTSTQLVGVLVALRPAQTSYAYDAQGNRTSIVPVTGAATTLGYDQANRLTAYGTAATYAYNGDGLRTAKIVSGTTTAFTWDTSQGLPLLLTDGTTSYVYGPGGLPLEQVTASGTLYYHHDQLGSTRALTDGTGSVVATYSYDPYGNLTGSTGTVTNPFRYAGQYTDPETGYQYLRARYYDPTTAQFLTRDPLVTVTRDAHGYVDRNPLNETDPSGLSPSSWLTTPTELYNDQFVSGALNFIRGGYSFGTGMVMVTGGGLLSVTGLGAILGVPAQVWGAYRVGSGAANMVKGVSQMMQARRQPMVCKSPVRWGYDLVADIVPGGEVLP